MARVGGPLRMVQWWSRGRVETWPPGGARRPWAVAWPRPLADFTDALAARLRAYAQAEAIPGRLLPWLPVAFGLGIAMYFTAEREPAWWAAAALGLVCASSAVLLRRRPIAFPVALALTAAAAGFAAATLKSLYVAHPILQALAGNVAISGYVEMREERERSDRIVVRALKVEGIRSGEKPDRVRVSVRKGTAPAVGSHVTFQARLNPPLAPLRPGGYDFARDLYFQRIGAVGFVLGSIRTSEPTAPPGFWLRYSTAVESARDAINARIRSVIPGDQGAIASALITGKRDAISTPVNDAMYVSGLAHVLSISGYHMAIVAGVVFFALRAGLALIPAFASGRPTAGLVVVCLLKTPLRWCGIAVMALAAVLAIRAPQPDVLVAADGQALGVRGADGRLTILRSGGDAFTVREWLAADGDARLPTEPGLRDGFKCDAVGCIAKLPDGKAVSYVLAPDAFEEDCARTALVVSSRQAPPRCAATVVDRRIWRANGAMALRRNGEGWQITSARPPGQDRPWARTYAVPEAAPSGTTTRPQPRDATPRQEDLEPGD